MLKTLSTKFVIDIHDIIINETGGLRGLAKNKSLDAALNRIDNLIFYENINDLFEIAAQYAIALAQGHVFNDGNKRTAFLSMINFLFFNGLLIDMHEHDLLTMMEKIAKKELNRNEVAELLREHSVPLPKNYSS